MNIEYSVQICLSPIFLESECENKTSSASTNKDLLLNAAYKTMGEAGRMHWDKAVISGDTYLLGSSRKLGNKMAAPFVLP